MRLDGPGAGAEPDDLVAIFVEKWREGSRCPDVFLFVTERSPGGEDLSRILLFDQAKRQERGEPLSVDEYFARLPDLPAPLRVELVAREVEYVAPDAENRDVDAIVARFSEIGSELRRRLLEVQVIEESALESTRLAHMGVARFSSSEWAYAVGDAKEEPLPERIDRYPVERHLGGGGFKIVYLSHHEGLGIDVVVKIPRRRLSRKDEIDTFLDDARNLARLDHPGVVRVFDAGVTDDGVCYMVERYIEGTDLASRIAEGRIAHDAAARIVASVSEALHHVHVAGLVHRDIKPANILIDSQGNPVVTDFGLALKEEDFGTGVRRAGTFAYMSPEQAREEGHLVDGRSDIYSLGVVFYQLLTGDLPFHGTPSEVIAQTKSLDVRPPRQVDDTISRELERICLKALSKRAGDRYNTALDMAEDLRQFLGSRPGVTPEVAPGTAPDDGRGDPLRVPTPTPPSPKVIPKGLRSFDEQDSDFFLELLPGPRDRHGLPESIRFWKSRIEASDPDRTFRVGVLYGPSGCGKTSLVKAGLIPRLADHVETASVEATAEGLESRLLGVLRRKRIHVQGGSSLAETLGAVRRGRALRPGNKVLLVIDQFEQWLHGGKSPALIEALRQCDGERLQCLLLVRDDFWMGLTRFMHELEIPLVEGANCAAADLFEVPHAKKVLSAFGRAYGALPESEAPAADQLDFVDRAVKGLAEEGLVIPVHLALFAQMMKGREWHRRSLRERGGTVGIGVAFLEETFAASSAPPEHRLHVEAARAVLGALLPDAGVVIRGHTRSRDDLLEASGYAGRPETFDELMRILDGELRLLTPVDPEAVEAGPAEQRTAPARRQHYQLTHDYLVPPLLEWLLRKKKETARGRAELKLAERSELWRLKPEPKQLPTWWEWLTILALVRGGKRNLAERRMMAAASRFHGTRFALVAAVSIVAAMGVLWWRDWRVRSWVEEARNHWLAGPERWGAMCERLERAYRADPEHGELTSFLADISTGGSLVIHWEPADAELDIRPEPEEAATIGLALPSGFPRVDGSSSMRSGERLGLTLGHYRVRASREGRTFEFPVFIGQVVLEKGAEGWGYSGDVLPEEVTPWSAAGQEGSARFVVAAAETIEGLRIPSPEEVPEDMVWIPKGPAWCSQQTGWDGREELEGSVTIDDQPPKKVLALEARDPPRRVVLPHGFLIGVDEVSLEEFERWFERFGEQAFGWDGACWERYFLDETVSLTAPELRACWERDATFMEVCREAGEDLASCATREDLCRVRGRVEGHRYRGYYERLRKELAGESDKGRPVGWVNWEIALAYARAHRDAAESPDELEAWLRLEQGRTRELIERLGALEADLDRDQAQALAMTDIPEDVRLPTLPEPEDTLVPKSFISLYEFRPESLVDGYLRWLKHWVRFGRDLPVAAILEWAAANEDRLEEPWKSLPKLRKRLADPALELRTGVWWNESMTDELYVVRWYIEDLRAGTVPIDRSNFLRWLGREKASLERRRADLVDTMGRRGLDIDWAFRLEFGRSKGWSLPTPEQWEKAFRGADSRRFPWGNGATYTKAMVGLTGSAPWTRTRTHQEKDISPYGAWSMAGNVSEFVLKPPYFDKQNYRLLKGGNFEYSEVFANVGCLLGLFGLERGRFAGFRVVRNLDVDVGSASEMNEGR